MAIRKPQQAAPGSTPPEGIEPTQTSSGSDVPVPAAAPPAAQSYSGWPDPQPLDAPPLGPPVPLEHFPAVLRDHIAAVAKGVQIPVEIPAIMALATFATAAQRVGRVRLLPQLSEQLSGYFVGVAEPSERKSATYRAMTDPLFEWERQHNARNAERLAEVARMRRSIAGRVKHLETARNRAKTAADIAHWDGMIAELERSLPPETYPLQLTVGDVTVEKLAEAMGQQGGCMALLNEEGGTFLNTLSGRYDSTGKSDLDAWLQGYDGGRIQVERMSRKLLIERPRMSIGLVVQPDVLRKMSETPGLEERGLMSRFCFVWGPSLVGKRTQFVTDVDTAAAERYAHALGAMLELPAGDAELELDAEAAELWRAYYLRIETSLPQGLLGVQSWGGKHASRAGRIAAVFHLARICAQRNDSRALRTPIDARTMRAALGVADWLLGHALAINRRLFSDGALLARSILAWVRSERIEAAAGRDVFRHFRRFDRTDVEHGLQCLVQMGWAQLEVGAGRNKAGVRVRFHPSLFLTN